MISIGVWPNGQPKYFCQFHGREVGHSTSACILRNSRPLQQNGVVASGTPTSDSLARSIREAVADALPQFANDLLRYNIKFGIRVTLSRKTTEKDASTLKSSLVAAIVVYFQNQEVLLGFNTSDDRDTALQRLKISKDGDKAMSVAAFDGPKCPSSSLLPIILGDPPIDLNIDSSGKRAAVDSPAPTHPAKRTRPPSPDSRPRNMDVDDTKSLDDRVTDLETGLGEVRTKVGHIENKIDAAISAKIELKAFAPPDRMNIADVAPGRPLWFSFRRSPIEPWVPTLGTFAFVNGPTFQAVAVDSNSIPIPSIQVQGSPENLPKDEATAKK